MEWGNAYRFFMHVRGCAHQSGAMLVNVRRCVPTMSPYQLMDAEWFEINGLAALLPSVMMEEIETIVPMCAK